MCALPRFGCVALPPPVLEMVVAVTCPAPVRERQRTVVTQEVSMAAAVTLQRSAVKVTVQRYEGQLFTEPDDARSLLRLGLNYRKLQQHDKVSRGLCGAARRRRAGTGR